MRSFILVTRGFNFGVMSFTNAVAKSGNAFVSFGNEVAKNGNNYERSGNIDSRNGNNYARNGNETVKSGNEVLRSSIWCGVFITRPDRFLKPVRSVNRNTLNSWFII